MLNTLSQDIILMQYRHNVAYMRDRFPQSRRTCRDTKRFMAYEIVKRLEEKGDIRLLAELNDGLIEFEKKKGFDRIIKSVGNMLRITAKDSLIVKYIQEHTPEKAIVLLAGIGKCYPLLRSHKVLNNLHQAIDRIPVVMFYPGKYDGQELVLFGAIKDDNYYRAFRLVD